MNEAIVRVFAWEWFPFVHMCHFSVTVPQHVPLLLCQCSQSSVRVCFWAPAMLLGHCVWDAACRHLSVPFSQRVCVCVRIQRRERAIMTTSDEWCQRWFNYHPLCRLAGSLMASDVGWVSDSQPLGGSCSSLFGIQAWGREVAGQWTERGEQTLHVYIQDQEVDAPECHGANTDHSKTVREQQSHLFMTAN